MVFCLAAVHMMCRFQIQTVINIARRKRPCKVLFHIPKSDGWSGRQLLGNLLGLRRKFIGIELNPDYAAMARGRLGNANVVVGEEADEALPLFAGLGQ